jgi:selenide,water dikinase
LPQAALAPILASLDQQVDRDLLIGFSTADDAAVYRLNDELALVLTADFFTPILDDPFDFGRVAATNAMSDVYAMGATPLLALNLVGFPLAELEQSVLSQILAGGARAAADAGVAVGGGHSIDDPEPKYGMAVAGVVDPDRVLSNAGANAGDALHLSKPIGGGLVSTGAKRGLAQAGAVAEATEVMCQLNRAASVAAASAPASAMTDVTGFGLLGHLGELTTASGLAAELWSDQVPMLTHALDLARQEACISGGTRRNLERAEATTTFSESVPSETRVVLADAMTSGGLLIAVRPDCSSKEMGPQIGRLLEAPSGSINVV